MANITDLEAAQLSSAAYGKTAPPDGWTLLPPPVVVGSESFSIYTKGNVAVMAFKGSDNPENFKNDILNSGYEDWKTIRSAAESAFSNLSNLTAPNGQKYEIVTCGHSLGGGLAQTFALEHRLNGYGQNSLPVSQGALKDIAAEKNITADSMVSTYRSGNTFHEVNTSGDIATLNYSTLQGQLYLDLNPKTLASPYAACEVAGVLVAAGTPAKTYGMGMAVSCSIKAHLLGTQISILKNTLNGAADNAAVDTAIKNNSSAITAMFLATNVDPNNVVLMPDGTHVDINVLAMPNEYDGYSLTINGVSQNYSVVTTPGAVLSQSSGSVSVLGSGSADITGNHLSVDAAQGATVTIGGNGIDGNNSYNAIYSGGATVNFKDTSRGDVFSTGGTNIVNTGYNDYIGAYGGGITVNGNTNTGGIWTGNNTSTNSRINTAGATVTVTGGTNVSVYGSSAGITGLDGASFDVHGDHDKISIGHNSYLTAMGSDLNIAGAGDDSFTVGGNGKTGAVDTVNAPNSHFLNVPTNSNVNFSGIATPSNPSSGVANVILGSNDNLQLDGTGGAIVQMAGCVGTNLTVNSGVYQVNEGGSNNLVTLNQAGTTANINGNGTRVNLVGYSAGAKFYGPNEQLWAAGNNNGYCFYGTNDKLSSTRLSGYGFAGGRDKVLATLGNISTVANALKIGNGDVLDLDTAQRASAQLQAVIAGVGGAGGAATADHWDHQQITWSIDSPNSGFSANMGAEQEAAIQNAFDAWGKASGLSFKEVHGDTAADINLGWSKFDTVHSGVVGYTSTDSSDGHIQGATIRIEDSSETGLKAQGGELVYDGTDASLSQVLMHEIGHAIGLADNANAQSIESYYLDAGNRTLSTSDVAAARALYGTDQLIQSMASFGAPTTALSAGHNSFSAYLNGRHQVLL